MTPLDNNFSLLTRHMTTCEWLSPQDSTYCLLLSKRHNKMESLRKPPRSQLWNCQTDQNTKPIHSFNQYLSCNFILVKAEVKWSKNIGYNMTLTILWCSLIHYPQVWNPFLSHKLILLLKMKIWFWQFVANVTFWEMVWSWPLSLLGMLIWSGICNIFAITAP